MAEIQRELIEANDKQNVATLDSEIEGLKKNLLKYEQRRSNLLEAMELGEFVKDEVLDRLNNLKRLCRDDGVKLSDLFNTKNNLLNLTDAKIKLDQLYNHTIESLQNCTPEVKRLALDALDIKVYASTDKVEIQGIIPLELPTTAQTSG
ncbi:hypothetical protein ACFLYI_02530 [Chloroflexota bacterium]